MNVSFSPQMMDDLNESLRNTWATNGIINIPVLANELRQRHEHENIALEDISAMLLSKAQMFSAAMEFDSGDSQRSAG